MNKLLISEVGNALFELTVIAKRKNDQALAVKHAPKSESYFLSIS
ncbi:hypothetical protein [Microscilla marina]|uniref:Uncharacterized protein n=1 Tax=Microscilla marina ATCC 23134 TaxID=313606 RepID=A1ZWK8_MICM2|nr:hypothetical protein [Microscilla marina]EAY25248.1 hypothetical protein M23134_07985 [Microscilla marina ATCC 23134]